MFPCIRARVKRRADMGGAVHTKHEADGRKGGAGHAAASPFGRIAARKNIEA